MKKILVGIALILSVVNIPYKDSTYRDTNLACLASNIYHEARGERRLGQLAVAKVTINRSKDGDYCSAVFAKRQFSWTIKNKNLNSDLNSVNIALEAVERTHELSSFSATHFHATNVRPAWSYSFKRLTTIGNHIFYEKR